MVYLIRKVRTSHIDGPPCFFKSDIPSFDNLRYKLEFSGQIKHSRGKFLRCCSVLNMKECSGFVLVFKKLKSTIFTFRGRNL